MTAKTTTSAISPTRQEDYPEWFQQVIKHADMAESSAVRGCMVIKPWGYGIWENIQRQLDDRIKQSGHETLIFHFLFHLASCKKRQNTSKALLKSVLSSHITDLKRKTENLSLQGNSKSL